MKDTKNETKLADILFPKVDRFKESAVVFDLKGETDKSDNEKEQSTGEGK